MVGFMQNNPHHRKDVWEHTLTVLENIPAEPGAALGRPAARCGKAQLLHHR